MLCDSKSNIDQNGILDIITRSNTDAALKEIFTNAAYKFWNCDDEKISFSAQDIYWEMIMDKIYKIGAAIEDSTEDKKYEHTVKEHGYLLLANQDEEHDELINILVRFAKTFNYVIFQRNLGRYIEQRQIITLMATAKCAWQRSIILMNKLREYGLPIASKST